MSGKNKAEFILISGPNGSGKSRFAESLAAKCPGRRLYIATMRPCNEDNFKRIRKHRQQRKDLGFETLELPKEFSSVPGDCGAILLEDVSNLLANNIFEGGLSGEEVFREIISLREKCSLLVAVSISGLSPAGYEGETEQYIKSLNALNAALAQIADRVYAMKNGEAELIKGERNALF